MLEQVEKFRYLGGMILSNGCCTEKNRSRIFMRKVAYEKVKELLTAKRIPLKSRKDSKKCYVWSVVLYRAGTWKLGKKEKKYLESFEMWLWKRMEENKWSDRVRNREVLSGRRKRNSEHNKEEKKNLAWTHLENGLFT